MATVSVANMTHEQLMRMQASGRVYQERYDNALQPWDIRAPAPTLGQTVDNYRREALVKLKKQLPDNHKLRIPVRKLDNDTFDIIEAQILKAVADEAYNPASVPLGQFRRVVEINQQNGQKIVKFIGQECFVKQFTRPGRRVLCFNTPNGRVDASGRPMR
jgi:hypothetical protein